MEQEAKLYEISYLLRAGEEGDAEKFANSLKGILVDSHGIIISESMPKTHEFAYPVSKVKKGFFGWIKFLINPESLPKIKDFLGKEESTLRFLLISIPREKIRPERKKERVMKRPTAEEKQVDIQEIDKKLEEILGE